ncbi:MAG: hypothetical protein PHD48_10595 [Alphaproteobacteria bacterium]|nr:hypothetical protein [Alphaproteobacteria bacterium]
MSVKSIHVAKQMAPTAGIAIGPILFIIAVLGILAAAIAAGSGSFTTGTAGESNKAKASALIDIGQNLKIGFDRITANGIPFADVVIGVDETEATEDLFSPSGGGITAPSTTMGDTPLTDDWMYPLIRIKGIGTAAGQRVAVLKVTVGVCDEINLKTIGLAAGTATTQTADLGDFSGDPDTKIDDYALWPTEFQGKPVGCVLNENVGSAGYFFYQVIGIQ